MRLIDAESLEKAMGAMRASRKREGASGLIGGIFDMAEGFFMELVRRQPTIEAKPVVHAHWKCDSAIDPYCCSNCGKKALQDYFEKDVLSKYCPYCGAQMDEVVKNG